MRDISCGSHTICPRLMRQFAAVAPEPLEGGGEGGGPQQAAPVTLPSSGVFPSTAVSLPTVSPGSQKQPVHHLRPLAEWWEIGREKCTWVSSSWENLAQIKARRKSKTQTGRMLIGNSLKSHSPEWQSKAGQVYRRQLRTHAN